MTEESRPMDTAIVLSSFMEVNPTAAALNRLQSLGIPEEDVTVMSSLPWSPEILGRPHIKTPLTRIAIVSALVGLGLGVFFVVITPYLYIIRVGGHPIVPVPPSLLLMYEFIMLALIIGTFGAFLVLNRFPKRGPQYYDPELTNERISLVVHTPADKKADVVAVLEEHGGEVVQDPERREL